MKHASRLLLLVILGTTMPSAQSTVPSQPRLQGAWRIVELVVAGQTTLTPMSQPSLFIFTGKHFSFVAVSALNGRPSIADPSSITGAEALAVWGPFMAQSGTYEATATTLTVKPLVAKNPVAMSGGQTVYAYTLEGDKLTLTPQQNGAGTMAAVTKLVRVE